MLISKLLGDIRVLLGDMSIPHFEKQRSLSTLEQGIDKQTCAKIVMCWYGFFKPRADLDSQYSSGLMPGFRAVERKAVISYTKYAELTFGFII